MIVHLTELEQKLTEALQAAELELSQANAALAQAQEALTRQRERQRAAELLKQVGAHLQQMDQLQRIDDNDPVTGKSYAPDSNEPRYGSIITAIDTQLNSFQSNLKECEQIHARLSKRVSAQQQQVQALQKQLEQARPSIRKRTVTLRDDSGNETSFTIAYRTTTVMPWGDAGPDDRRFKRIRNTITILLILISLIMPLIPVPELAPDEISAIPPRLAQLLEKREPPPPPPPKVEQQKPEEKVAEKRELKPRKEAPKPQTEEQRKAREVASRSGLLAFSDSFADLMDNDAEEKLGKQARVTSGGETAVRTERSLVTSNATSGSGGINTARLSRDTGGVGLGSKGGGTRVTGVIGGEDFGDTDRPLSDSYKGSRTDEEIQLVFDRNKSILYSIYQRELRKDPTLQGKIVLRLTIEPSGRVSMCRVDSSDLGHSELEEKIATRVKLFNFGAKDVDAITITFPIDFLPG